MPRTTERTTERSDRWGGYDEVDCSDGMCADLAEDHEDENPFRGGAVPYGYNRYQGGAPHGKSFLQRYWNIILPMVLVLCTLMYCKCRSRKNRSSEEDIWFL